MHSAPCHQGVPCHPLSASLRRTFGEPPPCGFPPRLRGPDLAARLAPSRIRRVLLCEPLRERLGWPRGRRWDRCSRRSKYDPASREPKGWTVERGTGRPSATSTGPATERVPSEGIHTKVSENGKGIATSSVRYSRNFESHPRSIRILSGRSCVFFLRNQAE